MSRAGQDYYIQADHQGSVIRVTDSVGAVVNSYAYDAYGRRLAATEGVEIAYGYTGREYDAESGLMYYRARTYDPATGRFLQTDPLSFAAGDLNLYRYVGNDPVNAVDPDGRQSKRGTRAGQPQFTPAQVLRGLQYEQQLRRIQSRDPRYTEIRDPNRPITPEELRRITRRADQLERAASANEKVCRPGDFNTNIEQGLSRAPRSSEPNSIYEQLDPYGNLNSRSFYDQNGRPFSRQDFNHPHGGIQPHEHIMRYDAQGRPIQRQTVRQIDPMGQDMPTK
jgi:RHS repeat-associated protein